MPIIRDRPLKNNIRVWYNYLQTAINHKYQINKEYYRSWDLPQVRKLSFDKWWKTHEHLFANKENMSVKVDHSLPIKEILNEVKQQILSQKRFQITSKRFRYVQVDDYLKCWKRRNEKQHTYHKIGLHMLKGYQRREQMVNDSTKMLKRKFTNKTLEKFESDNNREILLQVVRRKVVNAEKILKNTASGKFTGKY